MTENIQDIYPLSPMQQGMLFHSLYEPESGVYVEQFSCRLRGPFDPSAFEKAWKKVMDRHPILRTSFVWEDLDEPLQIVHKAVDLPLEYLDWSTVPANSVRSNLDEFLKRERAAGLDLGKPPLFRLAVIRLGDGDHYLVWTHHHILIDGWSLPILLGELFKLYDAFASGQDVQLPPVRPYRDYIAWLKSKDPAKAEQYWRQALSGFQAPTPLLNSEPDPEGTAYGEERYFLDATLSARLEELARASQVTVGSLVNGIWALQLSRYSGEKDVVFGTTVSGRPADLPGVENMVGLFINTLPVRVQIDEATPAVEFLQRLHRQLAEIRQYEYTPLVQIQGWSDVPRDTALFESITVFENYPVETTLAQQESNLQIEEVSTYGQTNYPLTIVSGPGKRLGFTVAFDGRRFSRRAVREILAHTEQLLTSLAENPRARLADLDLLTENERRLIVADWNRDEEPVEPPAPTVVVWFEDVAANNQDKTGLVAPDTSWTFGELNARANRIARRLRELGVGPEDLVGISLERSADFVASILGVLKVGAAYVPLDPGYPKDRLRYMVADSGAKTLVTRDALAGLFENLEVNVLRLDSDAEEIAKQSDENLGLEIDPLNLAYVIYTSGSTGKPKGVLVQHAGLANLMATILRDFQVGPESRVLEFASFSFDASVAELFEGLLSGATTFVVDRDTAMSAEALRAYIRENKITVATLPPTMLRVLSPEGLDSLRTVISAGESCSWDVVERWADGRRFLNGYGPTEGTVGCAWQVVEQRVPGSATAPVGRSINGVQVYLLDSAFRPVPVGAPGEVYIGGAGVARGYLGRPESTAEKFLPDPFSGKAGARLYRTGDLGRYHADGSIEILGRVDFQVKIRGYRVEIGEIESVLTGHPQVQEAAVKAWTSESGEKQLVAYVVTEEGQELDVEALRDYLKAELPDYMVPVAFVHLDAMPLTPNRKIDRKALPRPEEVGVTVGEPYEEPRTPTEELLAELMASVLNVERVGARDDFFARGGHSLLATQLVSRIRDVFDVELPLRDLFANPTVRQLAALIDARKAEQVKLPKPPLEPVPRDGELPLSFAQQRLWFLDQLEPGNPFYNIPTALRLRGQLDVEALRESIHDLVLRHEVLRTRFPDDGGKPRQEILDDLEVHVPVVDLQGLSDEKQRAEVEKRILEEIRRPFDLAQGPLFRAVLFRLGEQDHIAVLTMHHIISDGWSIGIFVDELSKLYDARSRGLEARLPELRIQYADFAKWQRDWLSGAVLEEQVRYWKEQLAGSPPVLELPTDRPRPAVQTFEGARKSRLYGKEILDGLRRIGREEGATLFMTLLAAFQTLLARYSGQDDILVGTPIANRTLSETERLIGFFVNTLVMRTRFDGSPSFREVVQRVRETALGAYAHQDLPFEKLVEEIQPARDLSHAPIFQVMFALQNVPVGQLKLSELQLEPISLSSGTAAFDLTLEAMETADGLGVSFEYNTALFDASTIERMLDEFQVLLEAIVRNPDEKVWRLPLLTQAERHKILVEWNQTVADFPDQVCAHEWFEKLADSQPNAEAVRYRAEGVSYAELDRRASQLANYLVQHGVGPEVLVGLAVERSPELVVGLLGILKAGGAFVPLDPAYPKERLAYMIGDSGARIVLTQEPLLNVLPTPEGVQMICLDRDWPQIGQQPDRRPTSGAMPENLAYVIYTSGSTGRPKGTMLQHRGLCNLARWQQREFGVGPGSRVLQFSSLSFDASVWEAVMALLSGASLVLVDRETVASGEDLVRAMRTQKVTIATIPPSVLSVLPKADLPDLKTLVVAGEKCSGDLVNRWSPGRRFYNAYGPTEATVCASAHLCQGEYPQGPPIGKPISNAKLYVLGREMEPVPVGVPGELYIGGEGLARGYLGRPDLTAERFVPDPFGTTPGGRLYRSGDLVKWLPSGDLEFLGRVDDQVKIRGFRIELGEIESVLTEHPHVRDAVVLAREVGKSGDRRLVGYVVPTEGSSVNPGELRTYLRGKLPEYMVPPVIMVLDEFPLTPNGKVDRRALPAPEGLRPDLEREYVAPRNETEEKVALICQDLLGIDKVGIYDNFFDLGGHSLLATQLMSRLRETFGIEMPLRALFEGPTVAELAKAIEKLKEGNGQAAAPTIKRVSREARRMKRSQLGTEAARGKDTMGKAGE